jgi:acetyl-CoA C-acetyltransferase
VDFFELTDSYSIYTALSLEAAGFAKQGEGWKLAGKSKIPISTLGGWKGRGNPLGAGGAYQLAEAVLQLRGEAGKAQLKNARRAMVQTLGGAAATAITHILEK